MEFQYRAGDERRSRSPPPPTPSPPAAPSTSGSGSADAHGGDDGPAERVSDAALVPPDVAAADSSDELRRQAEKARIRERILREEAEHWELELEVRREIREQLLRLSWPALGRSAGVSATPARIVLGNASLPVAAHDEVRANGLGASPAKRKSPDHAAASTVSAATSSKKQKITLTCMVCDISTNSEKGMQDHLNGKVHKRKATALLKLPKPLTEPEPETGEEAVLVPSGDYTPTKLTMLTNAGALNEVMQMDGYLLCEVCNVRTADRVTMMCHLEGSKHISKSQKYGQASSKPPDEAAKKVVKGVSVPEAPIAGVGSADPETLVLELHGVPHTVRRSKGLLLCELCNVRTPSMNGMQNHLSGKKHKNKANASSDVSANVSTGGEEAPKPPQPMDTDTAVVAGMSVQVEVPLAMSLEEKVGDDSEQQETTKTSTKQDVNAGDSTKAHGKKVTKASGSTAAAQDNNVCDPDSLNMEVDSLEHPLQRVDGFLVCPCCNVKAPSEIIMRSHLSGKKHKRNRTLAAGVNKDASVLAGGGDEVQGNSSKSMKANVDVESAPSPPVTREKNNATMAPMKVDRLAENKAATFIEHAEHGEITRAQSKSSKSVKADEDTESVLSLTALQAKNDVAVAPMEVDADGTAEVEPAIHMEPVVNGRIDEEVESAPQAANAAAMAPIEGDVHSKVQPATRIEPAEDGELTQPIDHPSTRTNGSVTQVEESVQKADTAAPGKPMKIQVEGKVFTVLQQDNGRLSCETCGVHGCNKDSMILHLYTRTHSDRANLAESMKEQEAAAAACGGGQ
ncbi:uncharacterized protein C2845_PM13G25860 [Panicum miliaceum]|uniref:C2H2-type domain-containing protein n=1 Tax=Panicum miliaceum TaxID=4540 RepID=A0A3L6RH29_PANMI|nr:uncharacterized protein C2845_PM13G25860 [Panicum miliaceum]